jgi:hypothetical protein
MLVEEIVVSDDDASQYSFDSKRNKSNSMDGFAAINRTQAISVIRGVRYCVFTNKNHALNT